MVRTTPPLPQVVRGMAIHRVPPDPSTIAAFQSAGRWAEAITLLGLLPSDGRPAPAQSSSHQIVFPS